MAVTHFCRAPPQVLVWLTWAFIAAVLALLVLTYNLFPGRRTVALALKCVWLVRRLPA